MKPLIFFTSCILILGCKKDQIDFQNKTSIKSSMDHHSYKLLEDSRIHSLSVGVYKSGEKVISHYGELTVGKKNKPDNNSLYELGSVTKVFTGMLAANALLDGKIDLNDDVRSYLDKDYPNLEFKGEPIRIKHLLSHTSNFPNFPIKGDNKEVFFNGLSEIKITKPPGTNYFYSNTAPELMAYIIENVYQTPYESLLQKLILDLNDMSTTQFASDNQNIVKGYNAEGELMPNFEKKLWGGAVGLNSTTPDLLKFIELQLNGTNEVVAESHKKLYQIEDTLSIGYHWYISEKGDVLSYRHHGGIYGMQNWIIIYPLYDIGISVISNASFDGIGDSLENVAEGIFREIK